jgi:hypothetical protein
MTPQAKRQGTRVHDPVGGPPDLPRFFEDYERHFRDSARYEHHLQRVIAGYSRGDGIDTLRSAFAVAVRKLVEADGESRARYGNDKRILASGGRYAAVFRAALVYLTFALCLHAARNTVEAVLRCCDRGDPLLETLARAAAPGLDAARGAPTFPAIFDGLYEALRLPATEREARLQEYLDVWYAERMEGFAFKGEHLLKDQPDYVGYWCFEAGGVVAALDVNDARFAGHPHYPRDLVAMFRAGRVS